MKKTKIMIGMFGILMLAETAWFLILMLQDHAWVWIFGTCVYLLLLIASCAGMWKSKKWALYLSWFLASVAFGFGCYMAHFAWTFWLFKEPTLMERIRAVLHPSVSSYLAIPLLWFLFTLRHRFRSAFK